MLLIAALLVEAVVTFIDNIKVGEVSWKYWASLVAGVLVGVLVAVNWGIDVFKMVGLPDGMIPFVGPVLTGIIIGRGSNVVSDLVTKLGQ